MSESLFKSYRDEPTQRAMLDHVIATKYNGDRSPQSIGRAIADVESLNHVGLAYLYRDMKAAQTSHHRIDYDSSPFARP